ncbi:phosphoribosylglycinamide formyltransferase [Catenulispora rubra]|uniref:phosphoribosylglycinamide formyltransferase n=1 Tax=Catenulispora rubra TaxID=280293 RepID=UPI002B27623C|nr:phosphoribosylglycinamide formyltransferase [Catenulispora rubra]
MVHPEGTKSPPALVHHRPGAPARIVVLVSGSGTNLQALIDAENAEKAQHAEKAQQAETVRQAQQADPAFGATIVAVGADRTGIQGLERAEQAGIPTFALRVKDFATREDWDRALRDKVAEYEPDLVVSAGFMKLLGPDFLAAFDGRVINTHPALSPSFPGMHGPADALAYGVKVTGCTVFFVAGGVDDGPVIAQAAVPVEADDDVASLHERIKTAERALLVDVVGRLARQGWTIDNRKVTFQ